VGGAGEPLVQPAAVVRDLVHRGMVNRSAN
jgi:hypothetical protein